MNVQGNGANQDNDRPDGEERANAPPEEPLRLDLPAIESLEDYLRRYGLPSAEHNEQESGEFNGLSRQEAFERIRAEEAYRDAAIERQQASSPHHLPSNQNTPRLEQEGAIIMVLLANELNRVVPVEPLFCFCETVKRMVSSRSRFGVVQPCDDKTVLCNNVEGCKSTQITTPDVAMKSEEDTAPIMELSLVDFHPDAVMEFLGALASLHEAKIEVMPSGQGDIPNNRRSPKRDDTKDHVVDLINNNKISEQHLVECLKIAHYLQCRVILEGLSSVLECSIDAENCMAICSLADLLNLQNLFEASVNYVIERLDSFQGSFDAERTPSGYSSAQSDSEEKEECKRISCQSDTEGDDDTTQEVWKSLPSELRHRILTMRNVMRSSVIGRGSRVSGVFFSCGNEFLAIFGETIRDQRERLLEAKERREEIVRERAKEWTARRERRGNWFDSSSQAENSFVYGGDVAYALEKIEKQERRLKTLESFYEEQKLIFKSGPLSGNVKLAL